MVVALGCAAHATVQGQHVRHNTTLKVVSSKQTASIRSLIDHERKFISIKDIAVVLSLRYFENTILKKAEIHLDSAVLKFSADNAFVVQTNPSTKRYQVHQLSHPVAVEENLYFAPANETIELLKTLNSPLLSIDEDTSFVTTTGPMIPQVTGFEIEEKKNGSLLRIHLSSRVADASRTLQLGEWMYMTLPAAVGDTLQLDTTFASGIIRRIQPIQTETALQLSLQIRGKVVNSEIVQDQTSNDILLTLIPKQLEMNKEVNADSVRRVQEAERRRKENASTIERQKNKWKLDVIVLDAGHGGKDPGTIGVIGTREKDIALGISLKVGSLIEKYMPDVKVVYTRKTDRFVELYRRGQIANESEGKLFVSIHCNSTERKPSSSNGFEIYLLRPGRTEDAIRIAEKENAVVQLEKDFEDRYQNLTEENFIILTMAQSAYVKQSERFAELLEETMSADMEAQRAPVRQAGFYVLVGASMPNVLIETGYLSNPKEEKFLRSPAGQAKIAEAILKALQRYKVEYEQNIE
ncbi:MAG: N-acetylmuramoyl-L-alanine amidase [Ignavibacteriales bacterium]|nr:N-acetylmuramoyl-L-alanine amidase [Ignavibacteriales bacterium]